MALPPISLDRRSLIRYGLIGLALVASAALIWGAVQLAMLDREIRARFSNVRWTLPAQVYAAPQELYPGLNLPLDELQHELSRLGYREVAALEGPGSFVARKGTLDIATRAFAFWDGAQDSRRMLVRGGKGRIEAISDLATGKEIDLTRLDPMLIGSIYPSRGGEDRVLIQLADAPELLVKGLLAVEDRNFYGHAGISIRGIARAAFENATSGRVRQGASTITQQLVKNFFLTSERTLRRKVKEIFMSLLLELHFTKDEILEAYLNEIYMGQDGSRAVHGFGLASSFYFNKPPQELRAHELAMLVGIVKGPSQFDPRRRPDKVRERRDLVLGIWSAAGLIRPEEYEAAKAQPLGLSGSGRGGVERYPAFVQLVTRQLKDQYPDEALTSEGLRIFTTLSPRVQEALEQRLVSDLPELEANRKLKAGTLEGAGVVTSVEGGEVLAVVGGRDTRYAGFNRALDSRRSIGSLAKPFVYLAALMEPSRYQLNSVLQDEPITVKLSKSNVWSPANYDKKLHGNVPLYVALAQSYNLPTVRLGMDLGVKKVQQAFAGAGFFDAPALPSIFLGALDMSPVEVAQVYNTLAASGYQTPLSAIREVLNREGKPLKRYPFKVKQTLPEGPVYLTTWALRKVLEFGTARAAYSVLPPSTRLAGKTGTTDDLRDSWFAGYSADQVAVIWVGRDDYQPTGFTGASGALPIWARLMRDLDVRGLDDTPPAEVEDVLIDPGSGLVADEHCEGAQSVPYIAGYVPTEKAPCAGGILQAPAQWRQEIFQ